MRRLIILVVALLAIVFVVFSVAELHSIRNTLRDANPIFLVAAILVELICLCNTSITFKALYKLVGLKEDLGQLFLIASAANFVNLITPSAGMGGIAVFLDSAKQRNISTARVMVVGILYLVYEYLALFCVLVVGFILLSRSNNLNVGELIAAGFLFLVALAVVLMLVLGYRSSEQLGNLLAWLARLTNRLLRPFLHRDWIKVDNAHKFSQELAEGISALHGSPKKMTMPLVLTLNNKVLLLGVLAFSFLALNRSFTMGTLVGSFSVSYLFFYASPTPSGVGLVDGILPTVLSTFRIPLAEAVLITLVFRSVTIWFPFMVGGVSFRVLQRKSKIPVYTP